LPAKTASASPWRALSSFLAQHHGRVQVAGAFGGKDVLPAARRLGELPPVKVHRPQQVQRVVAATGVQEPAHQVSQGGLVAVVGAFAEEPLGLAVVQAAI